MKNKYNESSFEDYMIESNIDEISETLNIKRYVVAIATTSQRIKLHSNGLVELKYYNK